VTSMNRTFSFIHVTRADADRRNLDYKTFGGLRSLHLNYCISQRRPSQLADSTVAFLGSFVLLGMIFGIRATCETTTSGDMGAPGIPVLNPIRSGTSCISSGSKAMAALRFFPATNVGRKHDPTAFRAIGKPPGRMQRASMELHVGSLPIE
jgi:hypothetical protein